MWKRAFWLFLMLLCLTITIQIPSQLVPTATIPGEEDVVIRNGNPEDQRLTLTCNVDWGEKEIPQMLAIFKDKDIKITFFVSGAWAKKNPELLRKMFIAGHEIQSHGYHHKLSSTISMEEVKEEIEMTEQVIYDLIGVRTTVFAPPSGDYNRETVELCRQMGYLLCLWSADTIDWKEGSTASIIKNRVLSKPLPGAIVLMHPKTETVKALPSLIDEIRAQNLEIVPLSLLVEK